MTTSNLGLAGATGYVGTTLQKQAQFSHLYNSKNLNESANETFDWFVCSAAPAQKWIANREPEQDRINIEDMLENLIKVQCKKMILISTVDVFANPNGVTESCATAIEGLTAYGLHRLALENAIKAHFPDNLIVRLAGLVGPGLRKNVIYDFKHNNNLDQIDSRGVFQFYPMVNLWSDINKAAQAGLRLVHLTAEPVSVANVARQGFGFEFTNTLDKPAASYDFQTEHAQAMGSSGKYTYNQRESLLAIRAYAQG